MKCELPITFIKATMPACRPPLSLNIKLLYPFTPLTTHFDRPYPCRARLQLCTLPHSYLAHLQHSLVALVGRSCTCCMLMRCLLSFVPTAPLPGFCLIACGRPAGGSWPQPRTLGLVHVSHSYSDDPRLSGKILVMTYSRQYHYHNLAGCSISKQNKILVFIIRKSLIQ